jgi:dihydrofolate reductase
MALDHASSPLISLIAAVARDGTIGAGNAIPWHIPGEQKYFRRVTIGHPIVMGRKTHESIGRALPGRRNMVVSRDPAYRAAGCEVFPSLESALAACRDADEVFVIGGGELYRAGLPLADRLYLTEINADFVGDTRFPDFDRSQWKAVSRETHQSENGWAYDYAVYHRA